MEHVRLDDVVEFLRRPQPDRDRKPARGEMLEKRLVRHQSGHGDQSPSGCRQKGLGRGDEIRDAVGRLHPVQVVDECLARPPRQQRCLAGIEPAPQSMLGRRVGAPILCHHVVRIGTAVIAAQHAAIGLFGERLQERSLGDGERLRCILGVFHGTTLSSFSTPRRTWSSSIDSNSALKLPSPKP